MQKQRKVELLAPAGSMESFLGAINAGADAVYLGGDKFNARAYADNFSSEQLIEVIQIAHLNHRKVYLTLNTLIKEREFGELDAYVRPFYEAGLDGIIIQDLGVLSYCRKHFPGMELHASTQMTLTGSRGASFLKELGVCRIVPARELSLEEIRTIKQETDISIETFVHGAICYCYSGQCLFSSLLGGRSGNRGRCAQPCRLSYQVKNNREQYPLSLKDMCTIEMIPQLIEAGIDSFKIEGRMKKPEYAAGVTAIYRKYIDAYYDAKKAYQVEKADLERLRRLYIRSEISTGYYFKKNGPQMITLDKPGYEGGNEELLKQIREDYIHEIKKTPVNMHVSLVEGGQARVELCLPNQEETLYTLEGGLVQTAQKQPLDEKTLKKQFGKLGNSHFSLEEFTCELCGNVFMPIGEMNELRRSAIEGFEKQLLRDSLQKQKRSDETIEASECVVDRHAACERVEEQKQKGFSVSVLTEEQLESVTRYCSLYEKEASLIKRIYVSFELWEKKKEFLKEYAPEAAVYLKLPEVIRAWDRAYLDKVAENMDAFSGMLVPNLELLQFLKEQRYCGEIVSDASLYAWNKEACDFLKAYTDEICLPYELNQHEIRELSKGNYELPVYGRIPLMVTANCLKKTYGMCRNGKDDSLFLNFQDRYKKHFPAYTNCNHCYNVIYNSVPLSLHQQLAGLQKMTGLVTFRLQFTDETPAQTEKVLDFYMGKNPVWENGEYTNGHFKRGVM